MVNPGGKINNKGYFGIPLVSHIHANLGISGSTVYDIFADNNIDFNTKLRNAIDNMTFRDFFSVNQQLEIFSGGFAFGNSFEKDKYISFGLYEELDFIAYFPKDYAILVLEGNSNNMSRVFDTSHFNAKAELISVFHVGYNRRLNKDLTYGIRGKIYSSLLNVNSTRNKGVFRSIQSDNNFYNHIFDLDMELRTSGLTSDGEGLEASQLIKRIPFGGNLGLGFDVGFTYQFKEQWTVDASLLDIGFIRHSKDVENYAVEGEMEFEGVNPIFLASTTGQTVDDYWSEIEEDFEDTFEVDTTRTKFTTWRPLKLNASVNYSFGEERTDDSCDCIEGKNKQYLNALGAQLYAISRPRGPQLALTTYYYRRLFKGLSAKATYTLDTYSLNNIGLGISANLGGANLYIMADNFLQYKNIYNAQSVSLQLGFNFIFNKNED